MMHSHGTPQLKARRSRFTGQRAAADYFIYGCDKLYIGVDQNQLKFFFRKVDPKSLDHIVNKCLIKYVSEINALRFTIFHIAFVKNYLSDQESQFPSGGSL